MANREKGEVSMEIDGTQYTFVLTVDAMVALEDMFSTPQRETTFQQVMQRVQAGSVKHCRGLIWASLQEHHPEMTLKDVSAMIQAAGGIFAFSDKLEQLAVSATPDSKDLQELGVKPNPPKARAKSGTGVPSINRHAASA